MTAMFPGADAEVDHVVGSANRLLVMLHHYDRVAQVAQPSERGQEPLVVMLMQSDRRLVEHVEDPGQAGPDLRRQPDPLRFAS